MVTCHLTGQMCVQRVYIVFSFCVSSMLVTAKIKVSAGFEIVRTFAVYKRCLQFCVDAAWEYRIRNNVKLHPFVYKRLRKQLPAQLAVACIKQGCGIVKRAKSKPIIKGVSIRYNFPRSAG